MNKIEIPRNELGMSGYSLFSWKLWEKGLCTMAEAEKADQIMRNMGYCKGSDLIDKIIMDLTELVKSERIYSGERESFGVKHAINMIEKKYKEINNE